MECWVDLFMNWLKKPASPIIRNIVLATLTINVIVMIVIGQYLASVAFALILIGDIFRHKTNKQQMQKETTSVSDDVAEAMASKIKFEAEQHRKYRDSHNYIRMASDEEE